ncbi:MAG: MYXO-CTERM sorting domain-containing protein [Myxococcales bacterium]
MKIRANLWAVLGCALCCCALGLGMFTSRAHAGPPEELDQIEVHPDDPNRVALRYVNGGDGMVYSTDAGSSWGALCSDAIITPTSDRTPPALVDVAFAEDGTLFLGGYLSLKVDEGGDGCGWTQDPLFDGVWITDIEHHPSDPSQLFLVTATSPDGMNGMYRRQGSGAWELVGQKEMINQLDRVRLVELEGGGVRIYQSGIHGMIGEGVGARPNYVLRVSDDMGATWEEFAFGETDGQVALEAVDPSNPDRIVVAVRRERENIGGGAAKPMDSVMVSSDRGETFTEYAQLTTFGGVDVAADGRVWIGDRGDPFELDIPHGLLSAATLDTAPAFVNEELRVRCVSHRASDDRVMVCQPDQAGTVAADGSDYQRFFDFHNVDNYVACTDRNMVTTCRQQMLSGWCGASHFPEAKFCCPYPDRVSMDTNIMPGDEAPEFTLDCPMTGDPGDMMTDPDAGMAMTPDMMTPDQGTPSTPTGAAGTGVPATDTGSGGGGGDDGGCACAAPGAGASHGAFALLGASFALLMRRRRRPRR